MRTRAQGLLASSLGILLLTSGCTSEDEPVEEAPRGERSAGAWVADLNLDDVIVEQTVSRPDNPADEATFALLSLTVEGEVMILRLAVTPHFTSVSDSAPVSLFDITRPQVFSPVLVDMVNLKEYSVIADPPHYWRSESANTRSVNEHPMLFWAVYAAPEDDINTIEVRLAEYWPAFVDVPIER